MPFDVWRWPGIRRPELPRYLSFAGSSEAATVGFKRQSVVTSSDKGKKGVFALKKYSLK